MFCVDCFGACKLKGGELSEDFYIHHSAFFIKNGEPFRVQMITNYGIRWYPPLFLLPVYSISPFFLSSKRQRSMVVCE